jgi:hypothetical protein
MYQGIRRVTFQSTGPFAAPENLLHMAAGDCAITRSPVLGATPTGQPVVYYLAAESELSRFVFGSDAPEPFTMDPPEMNELEEFVASASFEQRELVAYVNTFRVFPDPAHGQLVTREVGQPEHSLIERSEMRHFSSLALAAFPSAGGALALVSDTPTTNIQLQLLGSNGEARGPLSMLSAAVSTGTNVALATRRTGQQDVGAVVFTEAAPGGATQQVVFRPFDSAGTLGAAVRLVSMDRDARNVSVTPFADGYAVAFRLLAGRANPVIQLAFVNAQGRAPSGGGERTLTDASASGGDVKVLTASDGRLVVAFTDRTDDGLFLRVLRANCL